MAGANKVILSVVTVVEGKTMLSIKMIDVTTANIEAQTVNMVDDVFNDVKQMTVRMINTENYTYEPSVWPKEDEFLLFLPPYNNTYGLRIKNGLDAAIQVFVDGEFIGSGTYAKGFSFIIDKENTSKHVVKIGKKTYKIDSDKYNYFGFETTTSTSGDKSKKTINGLKTVLFPPVMMVESLVKLIPKGTDSQQQESQQQEYDLNIVLSEQKRVNK